MVRSVDSMSRRRSIKMTVCLKIFKQFLDALVLQDDGLITQLVLLYLQSAESHFDAIAVSPLELSKKLEDVACIGTPETTETIK